MRVRSFVTTGLAAAVSAALIAAASTRGPATKPEDPWLRLPGILAGIEEPAFPDRDFPVTGYGAVPDGIADSTEAFRSAIAACADSGGGRVIVPAGAYLTGSIHLRFGVNLHLEAGSTIRFR